MRKTISLLLALAGAVSLGACGGGKHASTNANTTTRTTMTQGSPSAPQPGPGAAGSVAAVPATLHCGAVAPVWVNESTHVYHLASDPYYGRTKHGQYMCPAQAQSAGYHAAGAGGARRHHRRRGSMAPVSPAAQPAPSASPY